MSDQPKPVPEWEGNSKIKKFRKLLDFVGIALTIIGLFVSLDGVETMVGLLGLAITSLSRSKRFVRWVGKRGLEAPQEKKDNFFSKQENDHLWRRQR